MNGLTGIEPREFAERHARVRERMREEGLDALIAYSNSKARGCVRYLSNYFVKHIGAQTRPDGSYYWFGSSALLFPLNGGDPPVLVTDQVWDEDRARLVSYIDDVRLIDDWGAQFGRLIAERGYEHVGIDNWFIFPAPHHVALTELAPKATFTPTMLIEQTYRVKSFTEIGFIRKAEDVAIKAVEAGFEAVGVGVREIDFAVAAEYAMRRHGEIEIAANSVTCGGPVTATGSSFPAQIDSYTMKSGDWAMFDLCPAYNGYAGDICRMIVAGDLADLDGDLRKMYDVTLRVNEEVIEAVRPGVTPVELNRLAGEIADRTDYGKYRIPLLGHSLGLDIHDPPDYYYDDSPLEENMCITIEPCFLKPGVAGTRVEDLLVVTADGCEVLSAACPKELTATG